MTTKNIAIAIGEKDRWKGVAKGRRKRHRECTEGRIEGISLENRAVFNRVYGLILLCATVKEETAWSDAELRHMHILVGTCSSTNYSHARHRVNHVNHDSCSLSLTLFPLFSSVLFSTCAFTSVCINCLRTNDVINTSKTCQSTK